MKHRWHLRSTLVGASGTHVPTRDGAANTSSQQSAGGRVFATFNDAERPDPPRKLAWLAKARMVGATPKELSVGGSSIAGLR